MIRNSYDFLRSGENQAKGLLVINSLKLTQKTSKNIMSQNF